jgi:hypothetical protein
MRTVALAWVAFALVWIGLVIGMLVAIMATI